jgi:hypothetical protein
MILQVEKIAPDSDVHVTITVLPRDETQGDGTTVEKKPSAGAGASRTPAGDL